MADDDLRRLEREATRGDPGSSLALAQALRRAGRADDAVSALRPAWRDPAVRAELAEVPIWTHPRGPDGTGYLDVRPLRATPRLRWHLADPGAAPYARQDPLIGGPLGLVTCRERLKITVLDPETGAVHATTPVAASTDNPGAPPLSLAGEVLFVHCDEHGEVRAIHAFDDQDLYQVPLALARDEVRAWDVRDPTNRPGAPTALRLPAGFRHDVPYGYTVQGHGLLIGLGELRRGLTRPSMWIGDRLRFAPADEVIYTWLSTNNLNAARHAALDRATGDVRWQGQGVVEAFDGAGVVTSYCMREVTLRDPAGAEVWTLRDGHRFRAMGPEVVVTTLTRTIDDLAVSTTTLIDRRRGDLVEIGPADVVAVARDVVYAASAGALRAHALDGTRLWELSLVDVARDLGLPDPEAAARVHALAPATDRLYAKAADATVYCLEA